MFCLLFCFGVVCLCTMSCVSKVASVSGLFILDCQCFWIVHSWLPVFLDCSFLIAISIFSNVDSF